MPRSRILSHQHAIGGGIGVVVLVFALAFRFFPVALDNVPATLKKAPTPAARAPVVKHPAPHQATSAAAQLVAGPPISLAPAAVIAARAQQPLPVTGDQADSGQAGQLLAAAAASARTGDVIGPGADSALTLVLKAAQAAPDDPYVKAAVSALHTRLVARIQASLATGDAIAARITLQALARLPGPHRDRAALTARVDAARQVQPLLERASKLFQAGKLEGSGGETALALYRKVLGLDPENVVAREGLRRVQQAPLDRALAAAAQGEHTKADAALADAAAILPSSPALASTRARIQAVRSAHAAGLMARAGSAFDAGDFALAQRLAGQAGGAGGSVTGFLAKVRYASEYAGHHPGQVFTDPFLDIVGHGPAMVVIPKGSFVMGAPPQGRIEASAEQPQHEVTIAKGFALARAEVTVAEFGAFVRISGYVSDADRLGGSAVYDEANGRVQVRAGVDWRDNYAGQPAQGNDPVVNVSWNDAHAYAQWLAKRTGKHYRLPSEAEYAYAERAGTTTPYWWGKGTPTRLVENLTGSGDRSAAQRRWANAFAGYSDGYWGPAPVMSFLPNPFGLYDMDGNVSEWVADCWHDNYNRAPTNGSAWVNAGCAERVIRGGSWDSAPDQDRSSFRMRAPADASSGRVGFRVARDL